MPYATVVRSERHTLAIIEEELMLNVSRGPCARHLLNPVVSTALRRACVAAILGMVVAAGGPAPARADLLLQSSTAAIDIVHGGSGSLDLSISNTGTAAASVSYFWVGVQLVAAPTATGTLSLQGVAAPLTNSLLTDNPSFNRYPLTLASPTAVGGYDYVLLDVFNASNFDDTLAGSSLANLAKLTFTASGAAQGTWTLYGVNQGVSSVSFVANANGDETNFTNLPKANDTYVALATITVIPEPPTAVLAASSVVAVASVTVLKRRRHGTTS